MQIKNIIATLAALAVGSAIAGPLPAGDSLIARDANNAPVDEAALLVRSNQAANAPSAQQLQQYQAAASQFASQHANQAPSAQQLSQAKQWWPNYNWGNNNWNYGLWYNYYCYSYYPQYQNYWRTNLNWYW